jgi:hypothetical protein
MGKYIPARLRQVVEDRARSRCEYCLIHREDMFFKGVPDHIIAEKHGGATEAGNLAYACVICNTAKGSDLGSIASSTGELVRFFNPRLDSWADHFRLDGARIEPRTDIGEVTARIFGFNDPDRVRERARLIALGRYVPGEGEG